MKISEVVSLLKAGYTKKEIEELRAAENVVTSAIEDVSETPKEAAPTVLDPPAAPASPGPDNSQILKEIQDLKKTLQMQNIKNDTLTPVKKEDAIDVLSSIINGQKQ